MKRLIVVALSLLFVIQTGGSAQQTDTRISSGVVSVQAATVDSIREWDANISGMLQTRDLAIQVTLDDPVLQDRRHETLAQYYQGVRVYGGSLSRQTSRGVTVSIIGSLLAGIALNPIPGLSAEQALAVMRNLSGGTPVGTDAPELIIVQTLIGTYALSYRATMSDSKTYFVDASSGDVLWTIDEVRTQSAVGVGTGALGDQKKIATMGAAGAFRSHDGLRPAPIRTYDTRGSDGAFSRLDELGVAFDSDFPTASNNVWTNPAVVDAHVHTGWTQDYLHQQQGWKGVDNRNSAIMSVVHSGFKDNAHFHPLFSDGRGVFAYGVTNAGVPITALDVVAHEVMHGVTQSSLMQRTGNGLGGFLRFHPLGPRSATYGGNTYSCDRVTFSRSPAYCIDGRFVTVSNHAGAINEAFSDVIGTATEFHFHPAGSGPLRGDYKLGEDIVGWGPNRALDVPGSINVRPGVPYPDHFTRTASYIVVRNGTQLEVVPWAIFDGKLSDMGGLDGGGVHINATVLGHAFYLAIEGGRHSTSGLTVQGVGAANRTQIERVFFRAMTVLMPSEPTFSTARNTIIQAARDLYGSGSGAERAVTQALDAVGVGDVLRPALSFSFSPSPAIARTTPCPTSGEPTPPPCWTFYVDVKEVNGVGFNVAKSSISYFDALGNPLNTSNLSFEDYFSRCGPGSSRIQPRGTACGAFVTGLGGRPSGSISLLLEGIDDNGNNLSYTSSRLQLSPSTTSVSRTESSAAFGLPGIPAQPMGGSGAQKQ